MIRSGLVGNITRITAWLALAVEVFDFAGKGLGIRIIEEHNKQLEEFGVLLFLVALVSWLEASNKSLAKLEEMSSQLEILVAEASKIDMVAKYGSGAVWLAKLLHPHDSDASRFPHCRAGGETLSQLLLDTYGQAAQEFHRLRSGDAIEIKLQEFSVINLFLENLVKSLPPNSVWLGISRLQDTGAWEEGRAEPSYYEFERAMESRVKASTLTCLRVLCFGSNESYKRMSREADRQVRTGLHLRSFVSPHMPSDLSLIWVPRAVKCGPLDLSDPVSSLENGACSYEPLCGLSFEIRGDTEVYKMSLFGPKSEDFVGLKIQFRQSWQSADLYSHQ